MKKLLILLVAMLPLVASAQKQDKDWADYGRYEKANAALTKAPTVVFMGNSITPTTSTTITSQVVVSAVR